MRCMMNLAYRRRGRGRRVGPRRAAARRVCLRDSGREDRRDRLGRRPRTCGPARRDPPRRQKFRASATRLDTRFDLLGAHL